MNLVLTLATILMLQGPMQVTATYYHEDLHGLNMANGLSYNRFDPTICAINSYPLDTLLLVIDIETQNHVVCIVQDRMSPRAVNRIDLSEAGFTQLAPLSRGVRQVRVGVIELE